MFLQSQDDMNNVWWMILQRRKWCEIHHNLSQREQKYLYMFQELCCIEFRQDLNKSTSLAIHLFWIKQFNWRTILIAVVTIIDENYMTNLQKTVDSDVEFFEVDVIETWLLILQTLTVVDTTIFVRIEHMNSTILQLKNERQSDLNDSEFL